MATHMPEQCGAKRCPKTSTQKRHDERAPAAGPAWTCRRLLQLRAPGWPGPVALAPSPQPPRQGRRRDRALRPPLRRRRRQRPLLRARVTLPSGERSQTRALVAVVTHRHSDASARAACESAAPRACRDCPIAPVPRARSLVSPTRDALLRHSASLPPSLMLHTCNATREHEHDKSVSRRCTACCIVKSQYCLT